MVVSKDSLNRRKSIAVAHQGNAVAPKRRRAHSVVPSELSPLTRSRLSLGPIKGILKSRPSMNTSQPNSISSQPQSQTIANADDHSITQSMDITQDYQAPIHDNFARKSMGRRVSFSSMCNVRFFNKPDTTSSSVSSQEAPSSPELPSSDDVPSNPSMNDENAYPGATMNRRRSSIRKSFAGSEDMDLTSTTAAGFIFDGRQDQSALAEEEFDFDENSDMDVTHAVGGNLRRRSSVAPRTPLVQISSNPIRFDTSEDYGEEDSQSFVSDQSLTSDADNSQPMEIRVPLSQALRPAHQDEAWLALVKATHSGDAAAPSSDLDMDDSINVVGGDDMDVSDAVQRVVRARQSLSIAQAPNDSMSISDGGFEDVDAGNETLNLSKVLGRVNVGGNLGRPSAGYQESTMDESEIYGEIVPPPHATSTPRPSIALQSQMEPLSPDSTPPASSSQHHPAPVSNIFFPRAENQGPTTSGPPVVFRPPSAPSASSKKQGPTSRKPPPKQFSAAFAPPVTRPNPKKFPSAATPGPSSPTKSPTKSPSQKRERTISDPTSDGNVNRPSPARRLALAAKWSDATATVENTSSPPSSQPKSQPLPVSMKAPFQTASAAKPTSSIRRPSDYFARRKSMAVGSTSTPTAAIAMDSERPDVVCTSPKKKAGIGLGRASMGSGPADAWKRFERTSSTQPTQNAKGKEKGQAPAAVEESPVQESADVVSFSPVQTSSTPLATPTLDPLADPSPSVSTPAEAGPSSPVPPVVDLSSMLTPAAYADEEPTGMDMAATARWRNAIPEDGYEPDEGPPISIEQFFEMTGIKFMDELTAPRRSMHPSQEPNRQARSPSDIPLSEHAIAMAIDVPQLVLYSRISRDLEGWMEKSKAVFEQAEEEAAKMTPELFTEYSRADPEGQMELLHQLRLIRTNTRALAKSDWYDWKLQWIEGLKHTAQTAFSDLENDARALEKIKAKADEVVPELHREYDEVMRELEAEQREVAEIEESDQDYLNELKASLAEQNVEVEALKAEVKEGNDQLQWLQERFADIEEQKREANAAITKANRILHIQTNSTQAEVFRLKDELEALEDLHMFRITKVGADLFEYIYTSQFRVTVPCRKFLPFVGKVDIVRLPEHRAKHKDDFPRLSDFLLAAAKEHIHQAGDLSTRQIVQTLADYWASTTQLCFQIRHISLKYPVEIEVVHTPERPFSLFKAHAMVLFPNKKAKVYVSFVFDSDTLSRWPISIGLLRCEVRTAYGPVDEGAVLQVVNERLSQASPSDHYACLLDACILAQEDCDS